MGWRGELGWIGLRLGVYDMILTEEGAAFFLRVPDYNGIGSRHD